MLRAIESGFVQKEIQESAYRYARDLESKEEIVIGVNAFRTKEEPIREILQIDPRIEREQVERLHSLRKRRNQRQVQDALKTVEDAVSRGANIMDPLVEALRVYATLGEVSDLLRKHFGEYKETAVL